MIKEALKYIVEMAQPEIKVIDGQTYSDKSLYRINHNPKADSIRMSTLTSLIDYIKSGVDQMKGKMIIHIESPTRVSMYSQLDIDREREEIVKVDAQVPEFKFNQYLDHETFLIGVQSKFADDKETDRSLILKFAGTVEAGSVAEYGDDGITQKATVKTGIASKSEAVIPSPAILRPFRTFVEVEQPTSQYIFRMKQDKYDGIQCGLFEADGGVWKLDAMYNIRMYLQEELGDTEDFIIIS